MSALIRSQFAGVDPYTLDAEEFAILWREAEYLYHTKSAEQTNKMIAALLSQFSK